MAIFINARSRNLLKVKCLEANMMRNSLRARNRQHSSLQNRKGNVIVVLSVCVVIFSLGVAACSAIAAPTPTAVPPTDTVAATDTLVPTDTATPEPTVTFTPSPTSTATSTPIPPLALADKGVAIWCLPEGASRLDVADVKTENAWEGSLTSDGTLSVKVPSAACTMVFTFNQAISQGMKLQLLSSTTDQTVWLEAPVNVSTQNPVVGYAQLTHDYIVNPPFWQVTYPYAIVDGTGKSIASGQVNFYRPYSGLCWDGSTPVPVTNYCVVTDPREREPHPENPQYTMVVPPTVAP
jgi:hypothetical protein